MKFGRKKKIAAKTLEAIGNRSGSAYILLDNPDHIPLYVSESIKTLMGLEVEDVMSDVYATQWCVSDDEKIRFKKQYDAWDCASEYISEFEFKNLDTNEIKCGKAVISEYDDVMLIEIIDMNSEITIREQLKEELEKVKTEERQKSDFLSKMSHEIRTPMNGILGMLTLAQTHINEPEEALKCLDKANGLSQFLLSLINDILDMSKIESGKVVLEHEKFDLLEIHDKLYEMFAGTIEQKGITFETRMEDMEIRYVVGDSLRLMQILINFVSNASKYTFKGGKIEVVFKEVN